jgi:hypothetical protein
MEPAIEAIAGMTLVIDGGGPPVAAFADLGDLFSAAHAAGADMAVIAADRLSPDFFRLGTGVAGEIAQKFVNYRLRLAIVGDISGWTERSKALADFVRESNRGRALWFVADRSELERRLGKP